MTEEAIKLDTKISFMKATQLIHAELGNRQFALQQLRGKVTALEGEIRGLDEALICLERIEQATKDE